MSKKIDWTGKGIFKGNNKGGALRQKFQKLAEQEELMEKSNEELAAMRPLLKRVLTWYMDKRKPIEIVRPFPYQTEKITKSMFGGSSFTSVNAMAKPGTVLTYKTLLKSTNQFLFEDQNGEEVAIYTSDVLVGGPNGMASVPNTGLNGLLYNTEIYETLLKLKENK